MKVSRFAIAPLYLMLHAHIGLAQTSRDPTMSARIERHRLDLDGDGILDEIALLPAPAADGPGAYTRAELKLSQSGTHTLSGSWDKLREGDQSIVGNLVRSRLVFIGRFSRAGTLVFLFGEDLGCCEQGLEIFRVTRAGVEKYFSRPEFSIAQPLHLGPQSSATLVGQEGASETAGTSAPDALVATTYDPFYVFRLEQRPRLDTAASVRITRARLGGFAGLSSRIDVMAVLRRDKSRYLWDETNHRPIP